MIRKTSESGIGVWTGGRYLVRSSIINTWCVFLLVLFLPTFALSADLPELVTENPFVEEEATPEIPALNEIIPLTTELSLDLAVLQKNLKAGFDPSEVEESISVSKTNLKKYDTELKKLKESGEYGNYRLLQFNTSLQQEIQFLNDAGTPLAEAIEQLEDDRARWLENKSNWTEWESTYRENDSYADLKPTFTNAHSTVDTALDLLREHVKKLLTVQLRVGSIIAGVNSLSVDVDALIVRKSLDEPVGSSPMMFSSRYFRQLSRIDLFGLQDNVREASQLVEPFLKDQGWIVLFMALFTIVIIAVIRRNKDQLKLSEHWRFVAHRPVSIGLLVGILVFGNLFVAIPLLVSFIFILIAGISFARLLPEIIGDTWKRQLVYGLIIFAVINRLLNAVNLPEPLIRMYVMLAVLAGLLFCLRQVTRSQRREDPTLNTWGLSAGALLFFIILAMNVWGGKTALAGYLLESSVRSILLVLGFWLLIMLTQGVMEWAVNAPQVQSSLPVVSRNKEVIISRSSFSIKVVLGTVWLGSVLVTWHVFDRTPEAVVSLLTFGFNVGSQRISLLLVIIAGAVLYGSFILSATIQKLLKDKVFPQHLVDIGVQQSLTHLIHYVLIFSGFLVAVSVLGVNLSKITIIFGALSVGIGFGLQNIVNNFVCGLIMLFERPIRVGDVIEFGGVYSEVKKIGLRATWVRTFNNEEIVVPNSDLITNQVTNCTLTDRMIRRVIPVGVAYGSDVPLVMETLMDVAKASQEVLEKPEPVVLFKQFGDSTLNFEVLVWIKRFEDNLSILSDLCQEIDRKFREADIEIAFPQMDLHLRTIDDKAGSILAGSTVLEAEPGSD